MKARVRTAKGRPLGSTRWLERQLNDPFVQQAKREGFRARSVYKLQEIDKQFQLMKRGTRVVDLGAAPGSWSQYAAQRHCRVVAVDLLPVEPIAGVAIVEGDFLDPAIQDRLVALAGGPVDLVLSDMAASSTGTRAVDRLRAEAIGEAVVEFASRLLVPEGACLMKLVRGAESAIQACARPHFRDLRLLRPAATRSDSSEVFILARGFKAPPVPDTSAPDPDPDPVEGA
ncbi:MAG: RlmE family RNA methyltransferase [Geminicoccaceae bacterium]